MGFKFREEIDKITDDMIRGCQKTPLGKKVVAENKSMRKEGRAFLQAELAQLNLNKNLIELEELQRYTAQKTQQTRLTEE